MYDYGLLGNQQHYGQTTPPQYNLANIPASLPIVRFIFLLHTLNLTFSLSH